jgi:hypothetical protein
MKKIVTLAAMVLTLICFMTLAIAEEAVKAKPVVIKGEVVSIDTAKSEAVIKNRKTDTEKTVVVDPQELSTLKQGEKVKVILKEGTNTAEKIKIYSAKKEVER